MRIGLDEVMDHTLSLEILTRKVAETIATDLAHEMGIQPATASPHGHICGTAARVEEYFAERVATLQHFVVGANKYVPCEVANDAQTHAFTLPMCCLASGRAAHDVAQRNNLGRIKHRGAVRA